MLAKGGDVGPDRIADDLGAATEGLGKGGVDSLGQVRQCTIGQPGHGVLLVDDQRSATQSGGKPAGAAGKASEPNHQLWVELANHASRLAHGASKAHRRLEPPRQTVTPEATDGDLVKHYAGLGHQAILDTSGTTQPRHLDALLLQSPGQRQRRDDVPPGAAGHDQRSPSLCVTHGFTPAALVLLGASRAWSRRAAGDCRRWRSRVSMSTRSNNATMIQLTTRLDPP